MTAINAFVAGYSHWIDSVSRTAADSVDRFSQPRIVKLIQGRDKRFLLEGSASLGPFLMGDGQKSQPLPDQVTKIISGTRVELIPQPDMFFFRSIELPSRAEEFLKGIVRGQIDRLTPWTAEAAAFGWSNPTPAGADRISIVIAATALSLLTPYVDEISSLGAHSVAVLAAPEDQLSASFIKVLDQRERGAAEINRLRKILTIILISSGIAAGTAVTAATAIDVSFQSGQKQLSEKLTKLRANAGTARQQLSQRRSQSPLTVLVIEVLSELLPDHTHVTELVVEANKVRLIGVTRDAPSLIELIERSGRFTRASFFAPTTRSTLDANEHFHIEAIIQPALLHS